MAKSLGGTVTNDIVIKEVGGTTEIYFDNSKYHPDKTRLEKYLRNAVFKNTCSHACIDRLSRGEVSVSFNLATSNRRQRGDVIDTVINIINP